MIDTVAVSAVPTPLSPSLVASVIVVFTVVPVLLKDVKSLDVLVPKVLSPNPPKVVSGTSKVKDGVVEPSPVGPPAAAAANASVNEPKSSIITPCALSTVAKPSFNKSRKDDITSSLLNSAFNTVCSKFLIPSESLRTDKTVLFSTSFALIRSTIPSNTNFILGSVLKTN